MWPRVRQGDGKRLRRRRELGKRRGIAHGQEDSVSLSRHLLAV